MNTLIILVKACEIFVKADEKILSAFSLDDQRGEGHPHWVVRWKEVEVTSEVVGKGGWGEVRVVISSEGYMWLQSVSTK